MKINIYEPVLGPKEGKKGDWHTVNGAKGPDRDEAISIASKHASIKSGDYEIKRVDIHEVYDYEWFWR